MRSPLYTNWCIELSGTSHSTWVLWDCLLCSATAIVQSPNFLKLTSGLLTIRYPYWYGLDWESTHQWPEHLSMSKVDYLRVFVLNLKIYQELRGNSTWLHHWVILESLWRSPENRAYQKPSRFPLRPTTIFSSTYNRVTLATGGKSRLEYAISVEFQCKKCSTPWWEPTSGVFVPSWNIEIKMIHNTVHDTCTTEGK